MIFDDSLPVLLFDHDYFHHVFDSIGQNDCRAEKGFFSRSRRYIYAFPEKWAVDWLPRHILSRNKRFRVQYAGAIKGLHTLKGIGNRKQRIRILIYQKLCIVEYTISDRLKFLFSVPFALCTVPKILEYSATIMI